MRRTPPWRLRDSRERCSITSSLAKENGDVSLGEGLQSSAEGSRERPEESITLARVLAIANLQPRTLRLRKGVIKPASELEERLALATGQT